jgi:hypothetical protein
VAVGKVTTGGDDKATDIIRTNTELWDSIRPVQNPEVKSRDCIWTGHLEYCGTCEKRVRHRRYERQK